MEVAGEREVEFRIHAYSRRAPDPAWIVRLGFRVFGRREQLGFLHRTLRRMERLTEAARERGGEAVRREAERLTARRGFATDPAHDELAGRANLGRRPGVRVVRYVPRMTSRSRASDPRGEAT